MPKVVVIRGNVKAGGKYFAPGSTLQLSDKEADRLVRESVVEYEEEAKTAKEPEAKTAKEPEAKQVKATAEKSNKNSKGK